MEIYIDDTRKIDIKRGQLWKVDKEFEKHINWFRANNGDTWNYHNEVIIVQNDDTINPSSVLVIPTSIASNSTYDVDIPLKGFCSVLRGKVYAHTRQMFSIEPRHLVKCKCQFTEEKMKEFDEKIMKLLVSGNIEATTLYHGSV